MSFTLFAKIKLSRKISEFRNLQCFLYSNFSGEKFAFGHMYVRPHETFHEPSRKFYPNEVSVYLTIVRMSGLFQDIIY